MFDRRQVLQSAVLPLFARAMPALAKTTPSGDAERPAVIPPLKDFDRRAGVFRLSPDSRIVANDPATSGIAETLANDLVEIGGPRLTVAHGRARRGDLVLSLARGLRDRRGGQRFADEGYRIAVGDRVALKAPTSTGLYWATRTILQQLASAPDRATLMRGIATDWPDYPNRGFMLDVGRRFFSADVLKDYVALLSWFKMNEFQVHLMDNGFLEKGSTDWTNVQRGFRLLSDNPAFRGLASADGAYDRATWDSLEDVAASRFVRLIPEIEGPAHALSVIGWKPELGLTGKSGDHLDLSKPAALQTMKDIFTEFAGWFRGKDVHVGADEYKADPAAFQRYYNAIVQHVRGLGKQPRVWGSYTMMSKGIAGYDRDVVVNAWNRGWYSIASAAEDGMRFVNTDDATLYVVPFANYYSGEGLDNARLYAEWVPSRGDEAEVAPSKPLGAMWAVWNDLTRLDYTERDVHGLIELSFPTIATKIWDAALPAVPFEAFTDSCARIGLGPGRSVVKPMRINRAGDIAVNAKATASSAAKGHDARHVIDREPGSSWTPLESDREARLTLDFGAQVSLDRIELEWRAGRPSGCIAQISADGHAWTALAPPPPRRDGLTVFDRIAPTGRYVKLTVANDPSRPAALTRVSCFPDRPESFAEAAAPNGRR